MENNCSPERIENLKTKLKEYTYKKKEKGQPFKKDQKYYIIDSNAKNCVNSIVCNQEFESWQTHSSRDGEKFGVNKCFSYDSKVNLGDKQVQLDTQVKTRNKNGKSEDFKVKVWDKGKYKYELDDQDDIYYRSCYPWGCKSNTSAFDIKGGRKTRRNKKRRQSRRK